MNKTCKDCIHLKVCEYIDDGIQICYTNYKGCENFKDKNRFIELPCAVGQKVYRISVNFCGEKIYEGVIDQIVVKDGEQVCFYVYGHPLHFTTDDIGKTVFLTKEDAEQVLKGSV